MYVQYRRGWPLVTSDADSRIDRKPSEGRPTIFAAKSREQIGKKFRIYMTGHIEKQFDIDASFRPIYISTFDSLSNEFSRVPLLVAGPMSLWYLCVSAPQVKTSE